MMPFDINFFFFFNYKYDREKRMEICQYNFSDFKM